MGTLGAGTFFSSVGSLSPGTQYFYRCRASNTAGGSWAASTTSFTTLAGAPTVTNASGADSITTTSANLNGNVTSTGGENPTVTIYWGLADGGTTAGSWGNSIPMGTLGAGAFFSNVGILTPGTIYYYRCYASNTNGNSWAASTANFTTLAAAPEVTNASGADNVTTNSAHLNGNVTSTGGQNPSVTIYWGLADGATTAGNWGNHIDMGALGAGTFFSSVGSLSPNTRYFYRCYASNTGGGSWATSTADFTTSVTGPAITDSFGADNITSNSSRLNGNVTSTGGQNPNVTIYWGLADGATTAGNWGNNIPMGALGAGIFFSDIGSLSPNTRYFYRCYASNPAGNAWAPGTDNFTTSVAAPAITNSTGADNIAANSARLNGNVTSTGGQNPSVTIYWGLTDGGTTAGSWGHNIAMGALGTGTFSTDISSLSPNTRYFYRCYASNSVGNVWAPGTADFTTTIPLPTIISFNPSSGGAGTMVTITGTNLTNATAVIFSGTAATSFTVHSATQITAVVGNGSSGRVSVTTPSGTGTSAGNFIFNAPQNLIGTASGGSVGGSGGGSGGGSVGTSTPGTPVSMPNIQVQSAALGSGPQVTAQVTNIGTVSGSTRVVLYVDGQAADSRDISLAPGDRKSVSFDLSGLVTGIHNVKVNNAVAGEVSVTERSDLNLFLISLATFLVVMAGLFIAYFHRRRAM